MANVPDNDVDLCAGHDEIRSIKSCSSKSNVTAPSRGMSLARESERRSNLDRETLTAQREIPTFSVTEITKSIDADPVIPTVSHQAPSSDINDIKVDEAPATDDGPFPLKTVLKIVACQILISAPTTIFAALAPYIYASLIHGGEDFQLAGTISSIATGIGMLIQVVLAPVFSQLLDMYGRRKLAIFSSLRALVTVAPLLLAGIIIAVLSANPSNSTTIPKDAKEFNIKLGVYFKDSDMKTLLHFCFGVYWVLTIIASATTTSQSVVAIGDICQSQRQRSIGIAMFSGCSYSLAAAAVLGAQLSLLVGSIIACCVAVCGLVWSYFIMPETIPLPHQSANTDTAAEDPGERQPLKPPSSSDDPLQSNGSVKTERPLIQYPSRRRIRVFVNPLAGFNLVTQARSGTVALFVLVFCLLAEISASDTLVYYLSITLDFGPSETSYIQMEQAAVNIIANAVIGPLLSKKLKCQHMCMLCSCFVAAALIVLSLANSKIIVFTVYAPLMSMASIMMPSLATIIAKRASSPSDVSLSMSTVMSLVTLLQSAAAFFAALVFQSLHRDDLWVTFLFSAAFTIPMFGASVYLGIVCTQEDKEEEKISREKCMASQCEKSPHSSVHLGHHVQSDQALSAH